MEAIRMRALPARHAATATDPEVLVVFGVAADFGYAGRKFFVGWVVLVRMMRW